jgi:hypothetical protein
MIKVIDNVTTSSNAKHLEELLLDQPWRYIQNTGYNQFENMPVAYDSSWALMLYSFDEALSPLMTLAHSILIKALHDQNMSISKLIRIRVGLTTRTPHPIVHAPHVDWDNAHMTALYYVNDSDGDTVFYKDKRDETLPVSSYNWSKDHKFSIDTTVTPKADRMVMFEGLTYHSSTTPCNKDYRLVINYNWKP